MYHNIQSELQKRDSIKDDTESQGIGTGVKIGIACGVVAVVGLGIFVVIYEVKKRKGFKAAQERAAKNQANSE